MNLIKVQHNPQDEVYKIHKDTIVKGKIETIKLIITFEETIALYEVNIDGRKAPITCKEDEIAKDIDSLLEGLRNKVLGV